MEPQQQQQLQQQNPTNEDGSSGKGGFLCRQSSTRWTPTTDQIRILKDLYYNNGVRSPSAEQIQKISARLRQYGKIEGKNVFYWFQNHKARERQKKRFTSDNNAPMQRSAPNNNNNNVSSAWKPEDHQQPIHNKYSNMSSTGVSSASSSAGMVTVGNYGYGSVTMEKSFRPLQCIDMESKHQRLHSSEILESFDDYMVSNFITKWRDSPRHLLSPILETSIKGRTPHLLSWKNLLQTFHEAKQYKDCSISCGGSSGHGNNTNISPNLGWVGVNPYSTYTAFFDHKIRSNIEGTQEEEDQENGAPEIETLPLFPMHNEDIHGYCNLISADSSYYGGGWYHSSADDGYQINGSRTSLELSLNSYTRRSPDSTC